jgi:APA family basic amino acid/polyamine antiporter
VGATDIALGAGAVFAMYLLNRNGVGTSARMQDALTALKLIVMSAFIGTAMLTGDPRGLTQSANGANSWLPGALWIAGTSAFWLGGFQVISQAAEERSPSTSLRLIGRVTVGSVGIGVLFYVGVITAASMAMPRDALLSASLPAAAAAQAIFHSRWGAGAVLGAGLCGILATLNAMMISGSRLLLALGRIGYLPSRLAQPDRRGTPAATLQVVAAAALLGVIGGRGLLIPVVDMASMSLIISYAIVCAGVLRLRRIAPRTRRPFRLRGGTLAVTATLLGATAMAVFVIAEPARQWRGVPAEWTLFGIWVALGTVVWLARRSHAGRSSGYPVQLSEL